MRIRVDTAACTGHAVCHREGPDVFVLDELGFNVTEPGVVPPENEGQARRGAAACPERAIAIEEP
ncbi:MAG: ferredoxin [Acidimicrobiales bacterium]